MLNVNLKKTLVGALALVCVCSGCANIESEDNSKKERESESHSEAIEEKSEEDSKEEYDTEAVEEESEEDSKNEISFKKKLKAEIVDSGECGENVNWELDADGVLRIFGEGDIYNYGYGDKPSWCDFPSCYDYISEVIIEEGITHIGWYTFCFNHGLKSITIPDSVKSIGDSAFYECTSLETITIPTSLKFIDWSAFKNCDNLTDIYYQGTESQWEEIKIESDNECLENAIIHFSDIENTENKESISSKFKDVVEITEESKKEIYRTNGGSYYFTFDSKIPHFEYKKPGYKTQQEKINAFFLDLQNSEYNSKIGTLYNKELIDERTFEEIKADSKIPKGSFSLSYTVQSQTSRYCSITYSSYDYGGGDHGYGWGKACLIDFAEGDILELSDIVDSIDDFKSFVADYFYDEYYYQYSSLSGWNTKNLYECMDDSNWYIKDDSFYVIYNVYQLSLAYVDGSQVLCIPLEKCGDFLNERSKKMFDID